MVNPVKRPIGAVLLADELWVAHKVLIEINRVFHVILGRRRKPSLNVGRSQRNAQLGAGFKWDGLADDHEKRVRPRATEVKPWASISLPLLPQFR